MLQRIFSRVPAVLRHTALLCCLAPMGAAFAADSTPQPTLQQIVAQQTALRSQVVGGKGAFRHMDRRSRDALADRQQRVLDTLGSVHSIDELGAEQKTDVFNDLEWIKATITQSESDRKICEYTQTVGSHRRESVCTTAREERQHREDAKASIRAGQLCNSSTFECKGD